MGTYDAINAAATARARAAGWPELTGHPKQLGWANTLREKKMREYDTALAASTLPDETKALLRAAMLRETRADMWIDSDKAKVQLGWFGWAYVHLTEEERDANFPTNRG